MPSMPSMEIRFCYQLGFPMSKDEGVKYCEGQFLADINATAKLLTFDISDDMVNLEELIDNGRAFKLLQLDADNHQLMSLPKLYVSRSLIQMQYAALWILN